MKQTLQVENIKCGGCASRIEQKVSDVPGVSEVVVDIDNGSVHFESDSNEQVLSVEKTLKAMGYPKAGEGNTIDSAKSYVSCMIGRVTK